MTSGTASSAVCWTEVGTVGTGHHAVAPGARSSQVSVLSRCPTARSAPLGRTVIDLIEACAGSAHPQAGDDMTTHRLKDSIGSIGTAVVGRRGGELGRGGYSPCGGTCSWGTCHARADQQRRDEGHHTANPGRATQQPASTRPGIDLRCHDRSLLPLTCAAHDIYRGEPRTWPSLCA